MRRDARSGMLLAVVVAALVGGLVVYLLPERAREMPAPTNTSSPESEPTEAPPRRYAGEVHERFQQAAVMLHAGEPAHALTALNRVLELAPDMPEARVNAGFALYELSDAAAARDQFQHAIDLRPAQVNAYYGLALALEALDDLDGALGAMQTYVHLADEHDAHVRKARSAIWEWRSRRDALRGTDSEGDGGRAEPTAGGES